MTFLDKNFLGRKFKEYRKKAKMTQEELAEKIDIAEKHYGKLERGLFMPSLETFFRLVEVLDIPLSEFGLNIDKNNLNPKKEELLKEIIIANDAETELIINFINSLKQFKTAAKTTS